MSCHPTHFEGAPLPSVSEEQVEKNWKEFKKEDAIDPRAIRRQHRFKMGHEPDFAEPESGWIYQKIDFTGEDEDPDQRGLLAGGPEMEITCDRCPDTKLRAVGSMSTWDIMNQAGVSLVNIEDIDSTRKKELQAERVVILACPDCRQKYQWLEEFLPKRTTHGQE